MGEYKGKIDVGLGIIANIDIKAPKFIQFICNKWGLNKCLDTLNRHERIRFLHLFGILFYSYCLTLKVSCICFILLYLHLLVMLISRVGISWDHWRQCRMSGETPQMEVGTT